MLLTETAFQCLLQADRQLARAIPKPAEREAHPHRGQARKEPLPIPFSLPQH